MGSVDKAAIVWTIAIVLIGASVAIVGSNFDQADSKQDMKMMGSMNDDMMMQDGKMTSRVLTMTLLPHMQFIFGRIKIIVDASTIFLASSNIIKSAICPYIRCCLLFMYVQPSSICFLKLSILLKKCSNGHLDSSCSCIC